MTAEARAGLIEAQVRARAATALARVWAATGHWRPEFHQQRGLYRDGAVTMFASMTGIGGDRTNAAMEHLPKIPWIVADREAWVRDAAGELYARLFIL